MTKKIEAKRGMKGFLMFVPNLLALCARLLKDGRVPVTEKALVAGAIFYALMPLDLLPDFIPFLGQVDDIYLIALTVLRLLNRTDEAVLRENWRGQLDIVTLAQSVAAFAPRLLPQRISRVLSSHVELAPAKKNTTRGGKNHRLPLALVEKAD